MIYKQYGNTGLNVSAVGFGGMRFDTTKSNEENAELVLYAYDKGINFFDTAPGYCADKSEDIFGIAFRQLSAERKKFFVSTKGTPSEFDTSQKSQDAVDKSLERLGIDYIDFYYVWCIRTVGQYELAMVDGGQYEGLLAAKSQGKIRHITISSHLRGDQLGDILAKDEFDGVLLGINILNFGYRWSAVELARKKGLGVVAMNPLSGGVIPQNEKKLSYLAAADETPTQAALRFCISSPEIAVTLNGFTTKEHIDMACMVADSAIEFSPERLDAIRKSIPEGASGICTSCGYCLKDCPKKIPISGYLQIYNESLIADRSESEMAKLIKDNHSWGLLADKWADAKDCIRCHRCEENCTQHINIMDRLEVMDRWEEKAYELEAKELSQKSDT